MSLNSSVCSVPMVSFCPVTTHPASKHALPSIAQLAMIITTIIAKYVMMVFTQTNLGFATPVLSVTVKHAPQLHAQNA